MKVWEEKVSWENGEIKLSENERVKMQWEIRVEFGVRKWN